MPRTGEEVGHIRTLFWFFARLSAAILVSTFFVSFLIERSIPGGFRGVVYPLGVPPEGRRSARDQATIDRFALEDNMVMRWLKWLGNAVRGDLGRSDARAGAEVLDLMAPRFSISIEIMLFAAVAAVVIGIPLGVLAALWRGRTAGHLLDGLIGLFQSFPVFIAASFLIWIFAVRLQWLPAAGWTRLSTSPTGNLKGLILPATALALMEVGQVARVIKSDIVAVLQMDYITAAIAKGLTPVHVLFRHALRPASLGLLNVLGLNIGALLGGAFIIEFIFGIGALGRLFIGAMFDRDLHVALATTLYVVSIYSILNGLVDVMMSVADPRIRRGS